MQVLFYFIGGGKKRSGLPWLQSYLISVWKPKPTSPRSQITRQSYAHLQDGCLPGLLTRALPLLFPCGLVPTASPQPGRPLSPAAGYSWWHCFFLPRPCQFPPLSAIQNLPGPPLPWLSQMPTLQPPALPSPTLSSGPCPSLVPCFLAAFAPGLSPENGPSAKLEPKPKARPSLPPGPTLANDRPNIP